jgi:hypothetical protein
VFKDDEMSDDEYDFYTIDKKKAFEYLKQFNDSEVSAKKFTKMMKVGVNLKNILRMLNKCLMKN